MSTKSRDNLGHAGSATRDGVIALNALTRALLSISLSTAGLAIKAGGSALAKVATLFHYITQPSGSPDGAPIYGSIAAATDCAAFVGSVTHALFNVFVHSVSDDGAGTKTHHTRMGTEGATRQAIVFPVIPAGEVVYGITEINPTGAGAFVGGTTALDDATVIPNAVFMNVIGAAAGLFAVQQIGNENGKALT